MVWCSWESALQNLKATQERLEASLGHRKGCFAPSPEVLSNAWIRRIQLSKAEAGSFSSPKEFKDHDLIPLPLILSNEVGGQRKTAGKDEALS